MRHAPRGRDILEQRAQCGTVVHHRVCDVHEHQPSAVKTEGKRRLGVGVVVGDPGRAVSRSRPLQVPQPRQQIALKQEWLGEQTTNATTLLTAW